MHIVPLTLKTSTLEKAWVWLMLALFILSFAHVYWQIENGCHFLETIIASFALTAKLQKSKLIIKICEPTKDLARIDVAAFGILFAIGYFFAVQNSLFLEFIIYCVSVVLGIFFSIAMGENGKKCKKDDIFKILKSASRLKFLNLVFGEALKALNEKLSSTFLIKLKTINNLFIAIMGDNLSKLKIISINLTPKLFPRPQDACA